jgi:uncharacterized protein (DUF2147 family)
MKRRNLFAIAGALALLFPAAQLPAAPVKVVAADPGGLWFTEGHRSAVRFVPCGSGWCGHIDRILIRDPGAPEQDVKNPIPGLRSRPILGLRLLDLPRAQGDGWQGKVYDPRSGSTYNATVRRIGADVLEVKGCLMIFCQAQRWTAR